MTSGPHLVATLKEHVLDTMRGMPECRRETGTGAGYRLIEEIAGLDVELQGQNGWLTWSLLMRLNQEGHIEVVPGTEKRRKFRLT